MNPTTAIETLIEAGMTEAKIAEAVKVNQSTINRIRNGVVEPRYTLGHNLVQLAESLGKRKRRSKPAA